MHTVICTNILKSHWISHFNIAHLHASKELELDLWSYAPLSQFIHSCAKREPMTCSHSKTSLVDLISQRVFCIKAYWIGMLLVHHSLLALFSCHHPFFQSIFTMLTCEKIENRRRRKAQQGAQIIPLHPSSWFISSTAIIFSATLQRIGFGRITSWAFGVIKEWWFNQCMEAHADPCVGTPNYGLNSNVMAAVIRIVIKSEGSPPDGRGFHFWHNTEVAS